MTTELERQTYMTALAGLLHDIGKFGQRAGETGTNNSNKHPAVGNKFVNQHVPAVWRGAMAPVGWHHGDPDHPGRLDGLGLPVKIVALADRLSSGEREQLGQDSDRPKQLISIFSRLSLDDQRPEAPPTYLPLKPLSLKRENIFPQETPLDEQQMKREYRTLWENFCAEADILAAAHTGDNADIEAYLESMLHILRQYTWSIPSAFYYARPDVSLYEHLHTTAALSACFTQEWNKRNDEQKIDELLDAIRNQTPPSEPAVAGLLVGDLSGIQRFIYSLHNAKRATSVLRARSFYIQMLVEASARYVLRQLKLPITNALYIGGGGFSLIVPPLSDERVDGLSRSINRILAQAYRGDIYLALGNTPLTPSDFTIGKFSAIQKKTAKTLEERKNHRFSELSADEMKLLFSPRGYGGGEDGVCSICGAESPDLEEDADDQGIRWCPACRAFRDLGERLRRAGYLLLTELKPQAIPEESPAWDDVLRALGTQLEVGDVAPAPKKGAVHSVLFALDDEQELNPLSHLAVGHKFLVNLVPERQRGEVLPSDFADELRVGSIKHFGVLAHQSAGAPYLGVLRMDMDNLGRIFSRGLHSNSSLSRQATLSLLLSVFFEGWVGEVAEQVAIADPDHRERLYSVYSGGDDLFFVGSWDAAIDLAQRVRRDLIKYTGRDTLGISAGIVLVHEKAPLYIAAGQAEGAESAAKHLRRSKDAMCLLNTPVPWERFGFSDTEGTVTHWADLLRRMIDAGKLPRGLLQTIQDLYSQYLSGRDKRGEMGPWVWRAAYWFHRAQGRAGDKNGKERLQDLASLLAGKDFAENIEWLALAARWAELATR